ncbi:MAG: DUF357 domain-containing protein [Candidatus Altiarchaeota archaeon]|nr:DUF357 domain-containing protein [Candidatus Altiarchaeota archaeon]
MSSDLKAKLEKYLSKARPRFEALKVVEAAEIDVKKACGEFSVMALSYYDDAKHFYENGDYLNALAALEYAEGWLDAGRALGIFKVK